MSLVSGDSRSLNSRRIFFTLKSDYRSPRHDAIILKTDCLSVTAGRAPINASLFSSVMILEAIPVTLASRSCARTLYLPHRFCEWICISVE